MRCFDKFVEHFTYHPELLLVVSAYIVASTFLCIFWHERISHVYCRRWYDLSCKGPNRDMNFSQINKIMNRDPLDRLEKGLKRRFPCKHVVLDAIALFVFLIVTLFLYVVVYNYPDINIEKDSGLIVPSGLLALVGAIVVVWYQVRLRARSSNRQAWINVIRKEISILIDSFPPPNESRRSVEEINIKMKQHLMNLELYLNPNENVHRAFIEVLRLMYGFQCSEKISNGKAGKQCMQKYLCFPKSRFDWMEKKDVCAESEWEKWHLRSVRLANVLLKREWEQVKHVK